MSAWFHQTYEPAAVVRITGEDSPAFLQGQFSNDLRAPSCPAVTYGLWLNAKGKVEADSFVVQLAAREFLLVSPGSPAAALLERLDTFVVADDVTAGDETRAWTAVAWCGEGAAAAFRALGVEPPGDRAVWRAGDGSVLLFRSRRLGKDTWEWLCKSGSAWMERLAAAGGQPLDAAAAAVRRYREGAPLVPAEIGPGDLPQEAGLETWAVSFHKGCYLGQEVMARLHSMGRVRRRLIRVQGPGEPPPAGEPVLAGGRTAGDLRGAVADGGEGFVGLAMVQVSALDAGLDFHLADGRVLTGREPVA